MKIQASPQPRRERALVACLVALALALIALGCVRVQQQHRIVKLGYELREAQGDLRRLEEEHRRLSLELSVLTNPQRLETLATGLGMVRPGPEQLRRVSRKEDAPRPLARRARANGAYWALADEEREGR